MKIKKLLSLLLVGTMLIGGVGCAKSDEGEKDAAASNEGTEKVFVVGTDGSTPGYTVLNDKNELEGFEIDVWNEIGKRTGYEVKFEQMPFSSLFGLLDDGRVDTIANAIGPNDERKKLYDFSDSYLFEERILLSAPDKKIESLKDLDGMSVGVVAGSMDAEILDILESQEGIKLERVDFDDTATNDVVMGKVDLSIQGMGIGVDAVDRIGEDKIQILTGLGQFSESAYPFKKDDENAKAKKELVNKTLKEMREDGTLQKISEKWFKTDLTVIPE